MLLCFIVLSLSYVGLKCKIQERTNLISSVQCLLLHNPKFIEHIMCSIIMQINWFVKEDGALFERSESLYLGTLKSPAKTKSSLCIQ
jgi:hypothetical protein